MSASNIATTPSNDKMDLMTIIKNGFTGTILSILTFFSISFLTIIPQLIPFAGNYEMLGDIGFPLVYYNQFLASDSILGGWDLTNLLLDCAITWVAVTGAYVLYKGRIATHKS